MRRIEFVPAELIGEGIAYTIMGLCIVFLILIIIMFVIKAMALFSVKKPAEEAVSTPEPVDAAPEPEDDGLELIAVITAAVAAAMDTSTASIKVRSYKKLDGGAWNRAGRREVLDNRF